MILGTTRAVRAFAYPQPTDLRNGYNGLFGLVKTGFARDPLNGRRIFIPLVWNAIVDRPHRGQALSMLCHLVHEAYAPLRWVCSPSASWVTPFSVSSRRVGHPGGVAFGIVIGLGLVVKGGVEAVLNKPWSSAVREHKAVLQWLAFLALVLVAGGIVWFTT